VEVDVILRRVERTAVVFCAVMIAGALVLAHGDIRPPLAVLGGGILAAVSYLMIVSSAGAIVDTLAPQSGADPARAARPSPAATIIKLAGRYALLALMAYVMIVRLRLHPLGLLAGASSVVAAVSIEAVRFLLQKKS
jgi:hypothetical protein